MDITVINRLASFGYVAKAEDMWAIRFLVDKVESTIKANINQSSVPRELFAIHVDMVCGEFLLGKKTNGDLDGFEIDINAAGLKRQTQGDTTNEFAVASVSSSEERLDAVIDLLLNGGKDSLTRFRRLAW